MSIKDEYSFGEFLDEFRMNDYDYFTYDGYAVLFDMCDELNYDLDAPAICGDFSEYDDVEEAANELGVDIDDLYDEDGDLDEDDVLERIVREKDIDARLSDGYTVVVYNPYGY